MREQVLAYIREQELMKPGDRVGVAVSGGADSVALLRLLLELRQELGVVLAVAHFNHQIRGAEADADERFVGELAREHGLEFHAGAGDVPKHAKQRGLSLETAARELRYGYFRELLAEGAVGVIATAHTLDDQAETVLMRLLRGASTKGLAGIYPRLAVGAIVRPLLTMRRRELEEYLRGLGQQWRDDPSNRDLKHLRNRVRHQLLPMLEREFNPAIAGVLADVAELARAEEEHWSREVRGILPQVFSAEKAAFDLPAMGQHDLAMRRRLVRAAAEKLELRLDSHHVNEILRTALAAAGGAKCVELANGWRAVRAGRELRLERRSPTLERQHGYEYRLRVPGEVEVREIGCVIRAFLQPVAAGSAGYNRDELLDARALAPELTVRNWRAGDRYWPAHSKAAKKVKELLQERKLAPAERRLWPVVASGQQIVWMRGFPVPAELQPAKDGEQAVRIEVATAPNS